jgi:hypothetical protein
MFQWERRGLVSKIYYTYMVMIGKNTETDKRSLLRPRQNRRIILRMYAMETRLRDADWTELAQGRSRSRDFFAGSVEPSVLFP